MNEPVLEARDLRREYAGRGLRGRSKRISAVDGVSLSVAEGETLGLVGESGCGKSTLAKMLVGLERPDGGQVLFRGRDVAAATGRERRSLRRQVQMIFQDPYTSLNPRLSVLDVVAEPLDVHADLRKTHDRRERVAELLRLVGLDPRMMDRYPHQFSGGQRQRIGIARALASEPTVLVCDEPVSALDVSVQAQVLQLLAELQEQLGLSLIFIAHDLSVVRHVSHRVAVMYLGRLAETGPTERVYQAPQHPYTASLLSAIPDPRKRRSGGQRIVLQGDPPSPADPPPGCRFHTRCWRADNLCSTAVPALEADPALDPHQLAACHHRLTQARASAVPASTPAG